ncbi:MAG TPA: glycosyltransferase family 4 protein [Candidatus Faeciplasma pullistercoris]|uniref:Glycosyltransferase family 4 protein n=1 Tax=Candidatus Faeciplasma pullistercoris TaxID=2840800 RepID=A0A9D1KJW5_9FIRM|nr:glycosyltransferase family 4 protein [Candidatus Faeciplasma pullistercoris]
MKKTGESKNKVCIFSGDISRGGGTEKMAIFLANALCSSGRFEVEIVCICQSGGTPRFKLDPRVKITPLCKSWVNPGPGYLIVMKRLYSYLKRRNFSVIIDVDVVLDVLTLPLKPLTGVKVISWEHFHYALTLGSSYRKLIRKLTCRFSDCIVTLTEIDASTYIREGKPRCRVVPIYNPIDRFASDTVPPMSEREKLIVSAGHLTRRKGYSDLVEAAAILHPSFPDWKFKIYGDGEERETLENLIRDRGLNGVFELSGFTGNLADKLSKASIFAMTSRSEGLPMVLLEAKLMKLPSVSYDILTGPSEIILNGVNGYLVEPENVNAFAESLARLMESERLREEFSANAWDNIAKFDSAEITKKWIRLLDSL